MIYINSTICDKVMIKKIMFMTDPTKLIEVYDNKTIRNLHNL